MAGLFISVYLMLILGLFTTSNFDQALTDLVEKKVGLLLFPFFFFLTPVMTQRQVKAVLQAFVASCVLTCVYCFTIATYRYFTSGDASFFTYHAFSRLAGSHAIYLALHVCFSILILMYYCADDWRALRNSRRLLLAISFLILVGSVFLLSGRTHIFILTVGFVAYFIYVFSKRWSVLRAILGAAVAGSLIVVIVFLFPENRERFKQLINYQNQYGLSKQWGEAQMRPLMWSCVFQLISREPVLGYGTGDVQDELHQCYIDNNYTTLTYFVDKGVRFNAHNQFFEIMLGFGVFGLLAFIASLILPFRQAYRSKNILYCLFLLLMAVSFITESYFERIVGVAFFAFFNSFLFFNPPTRDKVTIHAFEK